MTGSRLLTCNPRPPVARTRMVPPGHEAVNSRNVDTVQSQTYSKVLTLDGKECKFPFRYGGECFTIDAFKGILQSPGVPPRITLIEIIVGAFAHLKPTAQPGCSCSRVAV
ncbi:hypothetical protein SKAU_G00039380 [Synaphobranchus kaupii]|uniref:Uncharacterized protein n=1 Tax=Synaphobranchus kaupii TaxID=118154 RepID=A0A9Q1JGF9_SYNKA|nr:hypothetical protein SKAU_G00039380 [Synaphobranchus kaupii]